MNPERIRVAHIITHLDVGGAEMALARLIRGSSAGLEHAVWSLRSGGRIGTELRREISVSELALQEPRGALRRWREGMAAIRAFEPQVIQGWMYHANIAANFAHRALGARPALAWNVRGSLRATEREKFLTRRIMGVSRWFANRPSCLVNNSRASVDDHIRFGYPRNVWRVIPNGFDTRAFHPRTRTERDVLRDRFGIPRDAFVVGTIGRNHPIKGHQQLVEALRRLEPRARVVVGVMAGPGWEPESDAARALPSMPTLSWRCFGAIRDTPDLLACFDVFCLPSLSEGFPNILGEAMSCAVPCVATNVGDTPRLLDDTGILVPPDDVALLAASVDKMLSVDAAARAELGSRARSRIEANFRLERVTEQYRELYGDLAEGRQFRADA
jgi:glycosyltransferase involved in cell wall biosynthesis